MNGAASTALPAAVACNSRLRFNSYLPAMISSLLDRDRAEQGRGADRPTAVALAF
jgi:hypothetical protein